MCLDKVILSCWRSTENMVNNALSNICGRSSFLFWCKFTTLKWMFFTVEHDHTDVADISWLVLCHINITPVTTIRNSLYCFSHCRCCYSWSTLQGIFLTSAFFFCRAHQTTATHMRESMKGKRGSTACRWPSLSKGWSTGTKSWRTPW